MKLYGKKALVLILSLAMMLSMCSFSAFAANDLEELDWEDLEELDNEGKIERVYTDKGSISVPYDSDENDIEDALNDEVLVLVEVEGETDPYVLDEWIYWISDDFSEDLTWDPDYMRDEYTFETEDRIAGVRLYIDVELSMPEVELSFDVESITVPMGTDLDDVIAKLPEYATVESEDDDLDGEKWYIGDELEDWDDDDYDEYDIGTYYFETELSDDMEDLYDCDSDLTIAVVVTAELDDLDVTIYMNYQGDDDYLTCNPVDEIVDMLNYDYDLNINEDDVDLTGSFEYGDYDFFDDEYKLDIDTDQTALDQLATYGKLVDSVAFEVDFDEDSYWYDDNVTYSGTLTIIITNVDSDFKYTMGSNEFEFDFGNWFLSRLGMTDLDSVEFEITDEDGGIMYADKDLTSFKENVEYNAYEVEDLYFVPTGEEGDFEMDYIAYGDNGEKIEGTVTIECLEFLLVTGSVEVKKYMEFDVAAIEEMIEESTWDDYSLVSISKLSLKGGGNLYYDYDASKSLTQNNRISSSSKPSTRSEYFADDDEDYEIEKIAYVPATSAKSGTVTVGFEMELKDGNKTRTVDAIYQIAIVKSADITITTGIDEEVAVDLNLFKVFYEYNYLSGKKNYDIAYITFKNAPNANAEGWLYTTSQIKSPDGVKFYTDNKKDGKYAFDDLTFVGAEKEKTINATFEIYGRSRSGSTPVIVARGSVDFITGASQNLSFSLLASQVYNFTPLQASIMDVGNNDNQYITFTSLPEGGKLVYNWGTDDQEDVAPYLKYYLGTVANQKLVRNITFVPSYSSSKLQKVVSFDFKGYNDKGNAVDGTFNITVVHKSVSAQFTDVKSATYADSVDFLYTQGLTNGVTETTFGLYSNVTRAQFVTFLWRAAGEPAVTGVTNNFTDVKPTGSYAYAYDAILWAVKNGITNGKSATTFAPGANVTHQELLTFLYRYDVAYLGHSSIGSYSVNYTDWSSVMPYAQTAVKWADYKGIIGDSFVIAPSSAGTRATVALWLHRMLTL